MPIFRIETNLSKSKIPANFGLETSSLIARILDKPEHHLTVIVVPDVAMTFGRSNEPSAVASLFSIGRLGVEENKKHSAALFEHVEKHLGITKERFTVQYIDADPAFVGAYGTTYNEILKKESK